MPVIGVWQIFGSDQCSIIQEVRSWYGEEYTGKEVESYLGRSRTIVGKLEDYFRFKLFAYEISLFGKG